MRCSEYFKCDSEKSDESDMERKAGIRNERYQKRKEQGICVQCGKAPAIEGRIFCEACTLKRKEYYLDNKGKIAERSKAYYREHRDEAIARALDYREKNKGKMRAHRREHECNEYQNRKAQGICVHCGKAPAIEGHVMCEACALTNRVKSEEYWKSKKQPEDKKQNKQPETCIDQKGKNRASQKKYREGHKDKLKAYQKEIGKARYYRLKEQGICTMCKTAPAIEGRVYCEACALKNKLRQKAYYAKGNNKKKENGKPISESQRAEHMAYQKAYQKEHYHRLKEQKICVICGKAPAVEGRVYCEDCILKSRARNKGRIGYFREYNMTEKRVAYRKARYQSRKDQGICTLCGKAPASEGHALCPACMQKMRNARQLERDNGRTDV